MRKATSDLADTTSYNATTSDTTPTLQRNLSCSLHEVAIWLNPQVLFLSGLVPLPMPQIPCPKSFCAWDPCKNPPCLITSSQ